MSRTNELQQGDHRYVWHPFTAMRQWRQTSPLVIERGEGPYLIDTDGRRYIDGVSSLWCNVHGHRVPVIDQAVRDQLDKIAHSTLLGLASSPSIELAEALVRRAACMNVTAPAEAEPASRFTNLTEAPLAKVFFSDAGATALEVAFKMAVGYWFHQGKGHKHRFIGLAGAYHGDTVGSMSVGYSELFHKPFSRMVFPVAWTPAPDAPRLMKQLGLEANGGLLPSQDPALNQKLAEHCLTGLRSMLEHVGHDTAAIVIEPLMQGAAGMVCQPPGFLRGVAKLAREFGVLLIVDEVATGFGRTGTLFACQQEGVTPDILCLAKGITGGYLPLAATLATDAIEDAFTGDLTEQRTLYHGHTYTGNALACAAALASLDLFERNNLLAHIEQSAAIIARRLEPLREHPQVLDVRQRGIMVGIELCQNRRTGEPFASHKRTAATLCRAMRDKGLILRPLDDVLVMMPIPAMGHDLLEAMLDIVLESLDALRQG